MRKGSWSNTGETTRVGLIKRDGPGRRESTAKVCLMSREIKLLVGKERWGSENSGFTDKGGVGRILEFTNHGRGKWERGKVKEKRR